MPPPKSSSRRSRRPSRRGRSADPRRAERAIRELLVALGVDLADPNLKETPERVARAWAEVLVSGYACDPRTALGDLYPTSIRGAVIATRIPVISMCPHHLLPFVGQVHVGFLPSGDVPGFGRIPKLVDTLAHRLVLQEDLTQSIVDAIAGAIRVTAAVAVVEAQHTCVAVTDPGRRDMVFRTSASVGPEEQVRSLAQQIDASLGALWRRPDPKTTEP